MVAKRNAVIAGLGEVILQRASPQIDENNVMALAEMMREMEKNDGGASAGAFVGDEKQSRAFRGFVVIPGIKISPH